MIDPASIIADALFDYRAPPGERFWGRDRSFDQAAAIIDALARAGFVIERKKPTAAQVEAVWSAKGSGHVAAALTAKGNGDD